MSVAFRFNQLRRNAYPFSGAQYCSFDHPIYSKLLRNLRKWPTDSLIVHRGSPRDDSQGADLGQTRNQRFRQTVGEVLLLRIAREIF